MFRLDGTYQGEYRSIPFPDIETEMPIFAPYEFVDARWIVNGRVSLRDIEIGSATGEISLWGRNLFDNDDSLYPVLFGDIGHTSSYQPARTYGVDLSIRW